MKGILVGVDESSYARAALRWAVEYGADRNLPVTALLAWDYIVQHHATPDAPFDPEYGSEMAERVLDELVVRAVGADNDVRRTVVCDHAAHALIEAAGVDASLVVVGARGMSGFKGLLLGSVSRHLLQVATGPVAIVRDDPQRANAPVVVGVDGSEPSRRAIEWAIGYAQCRRRKLVAVHAWQPAYSTLGFYPPLDRTEYCERAQGFLAHELERFDTAGLAEPIEHQAIEGSASAVLLEAGCQASLVVLGSRGHGRFTNTLLGSVSDQVSHYATCPVVVVP